MPFDPSQLPELNGPPQEIDRNALAALWRMRRGELGDVDYKLDHRGAQFNAPVGNAIADMMLRYNGDWNAGVKVPLFGGQLGINAQERDGDRRYGLNYKLRF